MFAMDIEVHPGTHTVQINNMFVVYRNGISQNTMPASHDDMMDLDGPLDNTFLGS